VIVSMDVKKAINIRHRFKGPIGSWGDVIEQTEKLQREIGEEAVPPDDINGMVKAAMRAFAPAKRAEEEAIARDEAVVSRLERLIEESVSDERARQEALRELEERRKELDERKTRFREHWQEKENKLRRAAEVISRAVGVVRYPKDMPLMVHLIAPPIGESWATLLTHVAENPEEFSLRVWVTSPDVPGRAIYQAVKTLTFKRSEVPVVEVGEDGSEVVTTEYRYDAEWVPEGEEGKEGGEKLAITEVPKHPPIGRRVKGTVEAEARKVAEELIAQLEEKDPYGAQELRSALEAAGSIAEIREVLEEITNALWGRRGGPVKDIGAAAAEIDAIMRVAEEEKEERTEEEKIRDLIGKWLEAFKKAGYKEVVREFSKRARKARSKEDLEAILDEIHAKALELGVEPPEGADVYSEESEDAELRTRESLRLVLMEKCRQVVSRYRARKWGS
jgi:hypothetical protein